jgi:hypothetical protein
VVVGLLNNEELLEEERVKAKSIREKMANVVGGSAYNNSGYGSNSASSNHYGNGLGGSSKYDTYDNKKKAENKTYDYGNSLGAYGDYAYNKSTLDKYKDAKNDKPSTSDKREDKKPEVVADTKKPFEKIASKLSKPGERREEKVEEVKPKPVANTPTVTTAPSNNSIIDIFDISAPATNGQQVPQPFTFNEPPKPVAQQQPVQQQQQAQQQQVPVQQSFQVQQQAPVQQQQQQPIPQVQQGYNQQPQFAQLPQQGYPQSPYPPQQYPNQFGYNQFGQPNQFVQQQQQPQYNQYQQPQFHPQANQFGYQQAYNPAPQQQFNPYAQPQQVPQVNNGYKPQANLGMGITLNSTSVAKKEDDFGNFSSSSSTAQNVRFPLRR